MFSRFTPSYRGGSGPPLVCLHGLTDTWRTWELVLPPLERRHDVLAPTLPGHAGGEPLPAEVDGHLLADAVERAMDEAGFAAGDLVGNSLGGYVALQLASRGRAWTVVALAPAGGWADGDLSYEDTLQRFEELEAPRRAAAPTVDALVATPEGRRRATELIVSSSEHIPDELVAHLIVGAAACEAVGPLNAVARREGWRLDTAGIECPVRIVWGTEDRLLAWPAAAARYRATLPHADWVVLDGVGHCPQLDVPRETAELILEFSAR